MTSRRDTAKPPFSPPIPASGRHDELTCRRRTEVSTTEWTSVQKKTSRWRRLGDTPTVKCLDEGSSLSTSQCAQSGGVIPS
jgi:hypothetical protein